MVFIMIEKDNNKKPVLLHHHGDYRSDFCAKVPTKLINFRASIRIVMIHQSLFSLREREEKIPKIVFVESGDNE